MKVPIALLMCASIISAGAPALSQPLTERIQNGRRVCIYQGLPSPRSGDQDSRTTYVEPNQSCPAALPPLPGAGSPPGTAQLYATETGNGRRICTYVQGRERWIRELDIGQVCPMAAGMLPPESDERSTNQNRRRPSRRAAE